MIKPEERIVVVTGGSKGIGRSIALKFAEDRVRVILVHYDADDTESNQTLELLSQKGVGAESHRLDVSSYQVVSVFFDEIFSRYGKIDALINNAGITRDNLIMRMSEDDWDIIMKVNLKSAFNCTKAVIRPMMKQRQGRIVCISSVVGQIGNAGQANYAASKAGLMGFVKSVARETASRGITVNAVAPGFIDTEMTAALPEKVREALLQQIPSGKMGRPEDVAEAVYWLCSDAAGYITGQVIHVSGGMFM